jgi:hypothetical protein
VPGLLLADLFDGPGREDGHAQTVADLRTEVLKGPSNGAKKDLSSS